MATIRSSGQLTLTDMNDVVASATQPSNPIDGTLWWDTVNFKLFVYSSTTGWKFSADGLVIGGRNFVLNSGFLTNDFTNWTGWGAPILKTVVDIVDLVGFTKAFKVTTNGSNQGLNQIIKIKPSTQYTMSFWGKADSGTGYVQLSPTNGVTPRYLNSGNVNTSTWTKFVYTFKTNADETSLTLQVGRGGGASDGTYYFTGLQMEEGNIASQWMEAPEDVSARIQTAQNAIDDMTSDLKVTPLEKVILSRTWEDIKAEYTQLSAQATSVGVDKTAYDSAYTYLDGTTPKIATEVLANMSTTYTFASTTARDNFKTGITSYYSESQKLRVAIANKYIDNIDIGGRNLFLYSATPSSVNWATSNATSTAMSTDVPLTNLTGVTSVSWKTGASSSAGGYYQRFRMDGGNTKFTSGQVYTVSVWLKASVNSTMTIMPEGITTKSVSVTTSWQRFDLTFTGNGTAHTITFYSSNDTAKTTTYYMCMPKLEVGNMATDWTPAPEDIDSAITKINTTLGNMTDDNVIDFSERQYVKDRLTEIIGYVQPDATTTLPTTSTLDSSGKGSFYNARKSAINAGISSADTGIATGTTTYGATYDALVTKYNALKTYLEGLTPIDVWDISTANQATVVSVTKSTWRDTWQAYYQAEADLDSATAKKLKDNLDNTQIGGTNLLRNTGLLLDSSYFSLSTGVTRDITKMNGNVYSFLYNITGLASDGWRASNPNYVPVTAGDIVSASVEVFIPTDNNIDLNKPALEIQFFDSSGARLSTVVSYAIMTTLDQWQRVVKENVIVPANATQMNARVWLQRNGKVWISKLKLEKGTKATAWSPAPEDAEGRLTTVESKVTNSAIINTVTTSDTYVTDMNNLKGTIMGGRNYLLNSSFYKMLNNWYPIDYYIDDSSTINEEVTFDENTDIEVFFQEMFGEDSGDFNDLVSSENINDVNWIKMNGTSLSLYKGVYQNVVLDSTKSHILSFMAFKGNGTSSNLNVYFGDTLLSTVALTTIPTQYTIKFTPSTSEKTQFKLIGDTTSNYEIYVTKLHLEQGNLNPTDWTPAPEDFYEDTEAIRIIEQRVSQAEQKITEDAIISTVTNSNSFETLIGGKANSDDLIDLASKGYVDGIRDDVSGEIADEIEKLNLSTTYATKSELKQTSNDITSSFYKSGGMNLLKNSVGYSGFIPKSDADSGIKNWFANGILTRVIPIQTAELDALGFGSGIQFTASTTGNNTSVDQYVTVIPNKEYTLSWYINKTNSSPSGNTNGAFSIFALESDDSTKVNVKWTDGSNDYTGTEYTYASETITNGFESQSITFTPTTNRMRLRLYGYGLSSAVITGLMLNIGDASIPWTLAIGESFNTNVRMDINGVRVSQLDSSKNEIGFTQITPSEFAGYYDTDGDGTFEKVFYLNGDETVSKKVRALNEISMGYVKIIRIESTNSTGWAFIPSGNTDGTPPSNNGGTPISDTGTLDGGTF